MAGSTPYYHLAYFNYADNRTSGYNIDLEVDRFTTIDQQLYGIYSILGNGVVNGWTVFDNGYTSANGISIGISAGFGIINSLAAQTIVPTLLNSLPANSVFYVFATVIGNTNYNRATIFTTSSSSFIGNTSVRIAQVTTGATSVVSINNSDEDTILFYNQVNTIIDAISYRTVATKIDLSLDVKNQLDGSRLSNIDTEKITSGLLSTDNLPAISHTILEDIGSIPHAGLDAFTNTITGNNQQLLGEITSVNYMLQTMYMKYLHSDVDTYMINALYLIPGISPSSFIDYTYTTAQVDTVTHCIVGSRTTTQPVYFFTSNFVLPSPPASCIMQSLNNNNGTIVFGVNTTNSVNFSDYQVIHLNQVNTLINTLSNVKIGISLSDQGSGSSSSSEVDYEDYTSPAEQNTIVVNFTNSGATDTFNFRIKFYTDIMLTNLVYTADSSLGANGFSYNDMTFPVGGVVINDGDNIFLYFVPPSNSGIACGTTYYITVEYENGSGYHPYSNTDTFIQTCNPSFVGFIFFKYMNNSSSTKIVQFKIRFYADPQRTNLIYTAYSLNSQAQWLINSTLPFPATGETVAANSSVDVTFYPNLSYFSIGRPYYLVIDVWNGENFTQESADYTFETYTSNTDPNQYYQYSVVSNFSIMFSLQNGQLVYLNL